MLAPLLAALLLVLALAVAACGDDDDSSSSGSTGAASETTASEEGAASGEPIKVGNISSITNLGGTFDPYQRGVIAYFDWLNANGGIDGRPVELITRDDQGDPAQYASLLRELIDEGVVAMVGDAGVGTAGGGARLLESNGIPAVGGWANGPEWFGQYPNFFLIVSGGSTPEKCVPIGGRGVVDMGARRVAIVAYDIPAGRIDGDCMAQGVERSGGEVLLDGPLWVAPGQPDLRPQIQRIIDAGADGIVLQTGVQDMVQFIRTADQLGYEGIIYGGNGMSVAVINGLGSTADKWDGRIFGSSYALLPDDENPQLDAFRENVPDEFRLNNYVVPAWAAGVMFTDAVKAVGDDPRAISEWLAEQDGYDAEGLIPPVRYARGLDPQRCVIQVVNDGSTKWIPANDNNDFSCTEMFDGSAGFGGS